MGACNDNVLKQIIALQVVAGIWANAYGKGGQSVVTMIFTAPFILFSGWSGQLCDRYSKQRVTVWVKTAEIFLALGTLVALWIGSLTLAVAMLLFLGLQSSVFGPAKYGLIPEMVAKKNISRANGALNMFSNVAIIIGVYIGGNLSGSYPSRPILPGLVMLVIAIIGLISSFFITKMPPRNPELKFSANPFRPYMDAFKIVYQTRALLIVMFGLAYFSLLGIVVLQAIVDFKLLLNISDEVTSALNIPLIVGIGGGSFLAGYLSEDDIRLGLIPIGALGLTVLLLILGTLTLSVPLAMVLLVCLGGFGGFYLIPLQSLLQARAPEISRGRILGTNNFMGFIFIALGGAIYWLLRNFMGLKTQTVLVIMGIATFFVSGFIFWYLRSYFAEKFFSLNKDQ